MERAAAHRRLTEAGLGEGKATALTALLWNVHETGRIDELDLTHLSDAGFRHVDVCIIRELLVAALSRREATHAGDAPVLSLLGAFGGGDRGEG